MRLEDYPPQEPFSEFGRGYRDECLRLSAGIEGDEHRYGSGDPSQALLVFPSPHPNGTALVFLHGGGWTNGYKEMMAFLAPGLSSRGITFISAGYRLAPGYTFPANVEDVADAIARVYQLSARYGIDREGIFVGGHSAGAHLTSHLALTRDWQASRNLPNEVVRGCLPISGTYDFTPGNGLSIRPRFLGPEDRGHEVLASPIFRIETTDVPFLLSYGTDDFSHLITQARKFALVLQTHGVSVETLEVGGADHLSVLYAAAREDSLWVNAATQWMQAVRADER